MSIRDVLSGSSNWAIDVGDTIDVMRTLPDECVQEICTSPPYWNLRDYGLPPSIWGGDPDCEHSFEPTKVAGGNGDGSARRRDRKGGVHRGGLQPGFCRCGAWKGCFGLEPTPGLYLEHAVMIFEECRRILRDDGVMLLNIGDSMATGGNGGGGGAYMAERGAAAWKAKKSLNGWRSAPPGLKHKDMVGIPWEMAFALRQAGWYLRSEIIWQKKSPMPESVSDRPTKGHEQVFLLAKDSDYFYDAFATREKAAGAQPGNKTHKQKTAYDEGAREHRRAAGLLEMTACEFRNPRSVWPIDATAGELLAYLVDRGVDLSGVPELFDEHPTSVWELSSEPLKAAHFAAMPTELARRCLIAGVSERGSCPECGAPWRRVTKKERVPTRPGVGSKVHVVAGDSDICGNRDPERHVTRVETIGWEPTCKCGRPDTVPCVVFDPFAGAGTTLLVARRLGCRAIGIELNPEYADMARRRIEEDAPLFNREVS